MMSLPPSSSSSLELLHEDLVRWIYSKNWSSLRELQIKAIPVVLREQDDVILSAPTAGGKTEAAFLPVLSSLRRAPPEAGVGCLCISPLKALINDQYERLVEINRYTQIDVTPWHGDVPASVKKPFVRKPSGVLLITPESLESFFINRSTEIHAMLYSVRFVIVDELHAFFNSERGRQLQSLLDRVEYLVGRRIPRIALSATLADTSLAASFLRQADPESVICIDGGDAKNSVQIQLRGFIDKPPKPGDAADGGGLLEVADLLFTRLRGGKHLVFANSRRRVEVLASHLKKHSDREGVRNEFYPHHGSLDRVIREDAEAAIKDEYKPASIICTSTLELGIDIGSVESVVQIGPPPSVISLKQRLGRSGRRDGVPVLRQYIIEPEITPQSNLVDELNIHLVQSIATIDLLLAEKYEVIDKEPFHLSTLIQQILSVIAQHGSVTARRAHHILCEKGPFTNVDVAMFLRCLKTLGTHDLISQMHNGALVLGLKGERLVNHYDFYSAFNTPEEYRLQAGPETLGSLPIVMPLIPGMALIFAGRTWEIVAVDEDSKVVDLKPFPGGNPPQFGGEGPLVHDIVRQTMMRIYSEQFIPKYLDSKAESMLEAARTAFHRYGFETRRIVASGSESVIIPWVGDGVLATLQVQFLQHGVKVSHFGPVLYANRTEPDDLREALKRIVDQGPADAVGLASLVENKATEKHDLYLDEDLASKNFASKVFDTERAWLTASELLNEFENAQS